MSPHSFPPSDNPSEDAARQSSSNVPGNNPGEPEKVDPEKLDVEQTLREIEQSLLLLKARYAQVQADQQRQQELLQQKDEVERQLQYNRSPAAQADLKNQLKHIRKQLEEVEVALESQLFSWSGMKEVFWLAVRFGGLGVVIGWFLRSLAGG
ncbi:MAG TPA: DUF2203 domain-containing protein [Allocoleopsis sp.]